MIKVPMDVAVSMLNTSTESAAWPERASSTGVAAARPPARRRLSITPGCDVAESAKSQAQSIGQ